MKYLQVLPTAAFVALVAAGCVSDPIHDVGDINAGGTPGAAGTANPGAAGTANPGAAGTGDPGQNGGSGGTTAVGGASGATAVGGASGTGPAIDKRLMGDGTSIQTNLGGHWWTFVDRSGNSAVDPDTGKPDPLDAQTFPAILKPPISEGNGLEDGMYHVRGIVGTAPRYDEIALLDTYWDAIYAHSQGWKSWGVCDPGGCRATKYPEAGIGFGFKAGAVPLGQDAVDKVGISFKLKLGPQHQRDKQITVSIPLDLTDVPDPTLGEQFGTLYANFPPTGNASPGANTPICTFPGTLMPDGSVVGAMHETCLAHPTTGGHATLAATTTMTTFCLSWNSFGVPPWAADKLANATPVPVTSLALSKEHITKLRFEGYRPSEIEPSAGFDFFVDDVYLLDQAKWDEICGQPGVVVPTNL